MTPRQRKPLPLSTEKKWAAAISRSTKRGPRVSDPRAAVAAAHAPVVVAAVADSLTRITANRLASRANLAGNPRTLNDVGVAPTFEETHEHHVQKAPEGNEATGKATG